MLLALLPHIWHASFRIDEFKLMLSDWLTVLHAHIQSRFHVFLMICKRGVGFLPFNLACTKLWICQAFPTLPLRGDLGRNGFLPIHRLRPHSFSGFSGRGIAGVSIPNSTYSSSEQKSFYSGIKVQSSTKSITTTIPAIPAPVFQLFHSLGWNKWNRWNTLPALPIPKKCCIPFTIPLFHLFLFPKIIKRNTVLLSLNILR